MAKTLTSETLRIEGMTCANCESRIEKKLKNTKGIETVKVSYSGGSVQVSFAPDTVTLAGIEKIIEDMGYRVVKGGQETVRSRLSKAVGAIFALFALYLVLGHFGVLDVFNRFPLAEAGMGYGMLFVIGLLTSVHCTAMCGGINLSQCMPQSGSGQTQNLRPSFLYNLGRVVSYTLIGGIVGAIGSELSFSGTAKGAIQLAAGIFMIIMGMNMLGLFPWLRRFVPAMPGFFTGKLRAGDTQSKSPLYVGLLNGLMPCGPLQAMQLYAFSTGDPVKGAVSMLLFSLGTVPLMFGLGAASSILSKKYMGKIMTAGAALVIVLGLSMFRSGIALAGFSAPAAETASRDIVSAQLDSGDVQIVTTRLLPRRYEQITVTAGVPVKWTIYAENGTVNGCNNEIIIPEYRISKKLSVGENVIEFTPDQSGTFPYSCWMGMIRSTITVVEDTQ